MSALYDRHTIEFPSVIPKRYGNKTRFVFFSASRNPNEAAVPLQVKIMNASPPLALDSIEMFEMVTLTSNAFFLCQSDQQAKTNLNIPPLA